MRPLGRTCLVGVKNIGIVYIMQVYGIAYKRRLKEQHKRASLPIHTRCEQKNNNKTVLPPDNRMVGDCYVTERYVALIASTIS